MPKIDMDSEEIQRQLRAISLEHLGIGSFKMENSDRRDFKEVSKYGVEKALRAAFLAGLAAGNRLNKK